MTQGPAKKIGILTSGGDAPGMNPAIRAVVRSAIVEGFECYGIMQGYSGLMKAEVISLNAGSVANILQRGGTILKAGRCKEFYQPEGRKIGAESFRAMGLDGLVVIGGDGTFKGAHALYTEFKVPCVGIPGTIDNDIYGTDMTVGFDTALNTALDAIDKIRDTAASHDRLFIVEVMGRDSGFIAVDVGVAGGAEEVFIPENYTSIDTAIQHIKRGIARGKSSSILVTAEGQNPGRAYDLADQIRRKAGFESKVCILGHVQRGGSPTAADRILASRMGYAAVQSFKNGVFDVMIGLRGQDLVSVPLSEPIAKKKSVPQELINLTKVLSI